MKQIDDAISFARERGDFEHAAFVHARATIPSWLSNLASEAGISDFETQFNLLMSSIVRRYLCDPQLVSVIHAGCDLDMFQRTLTDCVGGKPPYILYHDRNPHLVLGFHGHSGGVCAVELTGEEPLMRFGEIDADNHELEEYCDTSVPFVQWVSAAVNGAQLDSANVSVFECLTPPPASPRERLLWQPTSPDRD